MSTMALVLLSCIAFGGEPSQSPPTRLYVRTVPPGAKVTLDGKLLGKSDAIFSVVPGTQTVSVELDGYLPEERRVEILAEEITRVELQLKRRPGPVRPPERPKAPLPEGPSPRDDYGLTPLLSAVWRSEEPKRYNLVRQLLVAGADANERFTQEFGDCEPGATALHMAASKGDKRMIGLLVSFGCRVDEADAQGLTAAYLAAQKATYRDGLEAKEPFYEVLKILLVNGASPQVKSKEGKTLLEFVLASRDVRLIELCRTGGIEYPGPGATIPELEAFIRRHPRDKRVAEAIDRILALAAAKNAWVAEAGPWLARLQDISAATFDPATGQILIMGPTDPGTEPRLPPLLWDDFYHALDAHKAGKELGVSIGTYGRGKATAKQLEEQEKTNEVPVEYIPESIADTHLGYVFFEIDRKLKTLSHGEDNLTGEDAQCTVPGYSPTTYLQRKLPNMKGEKRLVFARQWFEPPITDVNTKGYSMEIVNYKMNVKTEAYTDDPAPKDFGAHLDLNFEEYARQVMLFRELVRMHKLIQVARWFHDCKFPDDAFDDFHPLVIKTPKTTKRMIGATNTMLLMGGIRLAAANRYVQILAAPQPGRAPADAPAGTLHVIEPIRFGSIDATKVPVPEFVRPVLAARPAGEPGGWIATVGGRQYAVTALKFSKTPKR